MIKISVILPVFNVEQYIKKSLDSIVNQTLKDIEIIAVNDGSNDGSLDILQEYKNNNSNVIIINQENQGAGLARNNALNNAKGEYVAFMDPDDWYPDIDILEELYNKAVDNNVNICGGSFSEFENDKINTEFEGIYQKYKFEKEGIISFREYQFDYGYHRFIYNLNMLKQNDIYFPNYLRFQDPPFFVKAMICSDAFYAIPKITYCYRVSYNKVKWDPCRTNSLVQGLSDVLKLTRENGLANLHKITVDRINFKRYQKYFNENITINNLELLKILLEANELIDIDLLKEADGIDSYTTSYIIEPIRNLFTKNTSNLRIELDNIKNSKSYKIGYIITYIPKKFLKTIVYYKKNGLKSTIKKIIEKVFK